MVIGRLYYYCCNSPLQFYWATVNSGRVNTNLESTRSGIAGFWMRSLDNFPRSACHREAGDMPCSSRGQSSSVPEGTSKGKMEVRVLPGQLQFCRSLTRGHRPNDVVHLASINAIAEECC